MNEEDARIALREAGLDATRVTQITGGWAYWTYDVDDAWIARFPRHADIAAAAERELALLPEVARRVSFAVPVPTHRGSWEGLPFFAYRRIEGHGLTAADESPAVLARLGEMLQELHAFPLDEAGRLLGAGPPEHAWRAYYERLWSVMEAVAIPEMKRDLATRVEREFHDFVTNHADVPLCLIHNDLGLEHILIDETSALPVGIIDFEDAWFGDPAVDFVPLRAAFGDDALAPLLAGRDLGDRFRQRMWFYRWMGSVHAIIYGVTEGVDTERVGGLLELEQRIRARTEVESS